MFRRTPPLLALRAFEAAARHLSFTLAAAEMHLTQGAISRQVRTLEEFLGQKLFERYTRRIALTPTGEEYYRAIQQALSDIEFATDRARREADHVIITLNVLPTLGSLWLMSILSRFTVEHPHIEIRLVSSIHPVNFDANDADIAIRVGRLPGKTYASSQPRIELEMMANWKGISADFLFPDVLVPVVSPRLMHELGVIKYAADVLRYPLIHTASRRYAWADWLQYHGLALPEQSGPPDFGHFFMAIRAAADGKGIAILPEVIARHLIGGTSLVVPLSERVPSAGNYYLLTRESRRHDEAAIKCVCDWLLAESENFRHECDGPAMSAQPPSDQAVLSL